MKKIILIGLILQSSLLIAQNIIPSVYSNIHFKGKQGYTVEVDGEMLIEKDEPVYYNLPNMMGNPEGNAEGFQFDFNSKTFSGILYFGFINYEDYKYPQPVFFKKFSKIIDGRAQIDMSVFTDNYDIINLKSSQKGDLGYRVIDTKGKILYDGKFSFSKKKVYNVLPSIVEGPILSMLTDSSAVIRFVTNFDVFGQVKINNSVFKEVIPSKVHEIQIVNLEADAEYSYEVLCDENTYKYSLKTAPKKGSQAAFTFAYASDSRAGIGGGERNLYGTNAYIMKKSIALASQQKAAFMQFTGDLINGYSENIQTTQLQYANFKQVISPFVAYMPFYAGIGNHEVVERYFPVEGKYGIHIDRFPFQTESMEAVFAGEFCNPQNGPDSEDGQAYDPNSDKIDFPSYKENVYYYTYGNTAVIVLNSEYLYTPSLVNNLETSGGLHGYLMDGQLDWLKQTLELFEKDNQIVHVFVTQHTPVFPNGGHVHDAMWYYGDNEYRTIIAGKPMERGVVEQRDKYLDLVINQSSKVVAILTGDEHNYCKTRINPEMNMYPESWDKEKLQLKRSIYQINNGACGAPYYAQDITTPWSKYTSGFSTQNALVLFDIAGDEVSVRVLNPDTLEEIESYELK